MEVRGSRQFAVTLVLPKDVVRTMKQQYNIVIPEVVGKATRITVDAATTEAFNQAYKILESAGLTQDWVRVIKRQNDFKDQAVAEYYPQALKRAKKAGYVDIYFQRSRTVATYKGTSAALLGVTIGGGRDVTLAVGDGDTTKQARLNAIRNYAEGAELRTR